MGRVVDHTFELNGAADRLCDWIGRMPAGVSEVIGGPVEADALIECVAGRLVSHGLVDPADLRRAAPSGDRWTVDEVVGLVVGPVTRAPRGRCWLVVAADAAAMTPQTAARLLRILEEPPSPAWFMLCHGPDEAMPAPLRGRIMATVNAGFSDPEPPARLASEWAALVGAVPAPGPPMAAATAWAAQARAVARRCRPGPSGAWLRTLTRQLLDRWEATAAGALQAHPDDLALVESVDRFARAQADARSAIGLFVPPESLLGPVWAPAAEVYAQISDRT